MSVLALPLVLALGGCAQKKDVDDLSARVKALEDKVATLEKSAPKLPADPNSPEELAASKLMEEVQAALKANDYATAKTKVAELTGKYATTRAGKAATRMKAEIDVVGIDAKPIEVEKWFQGEADLSDSEATLLVFWEQWCPHCKREMPKMQPLAEKYKSKGLQVVGLTKVTKSATEEGVMTFLRENGIKFPVAKEKDGSMSAAYAVTGIPAAAVVKDGKVVWRGHPAKLTDEVLDSLLAG